MWMRAIGKFVRNEVICLSIEWITARRMVGDDKSIEHLILFVSFHHALAPLRLYFWAHVNQVRSIKFSDSYATQTAMKNQNKTIISNWINHIHSRHQEEKSSLIPPPLRTQSKKVNATFNTRQKLKYVNCILFSPSSHSSAATFNQITKPFNLFYFSKTNSIVA